MARCTLIVSAWLIATGPAAHATPPGATGDTGRKAPAGLAARVWSLTDVILDNHVDSPARQEMILAAIKSLYDAAELVPPTGLARRLSEINGPEPLGPLLDEVWAQLPSDTLHVRDTEIEPEDRLIGGLVGRLPGGARLLSAQEARVEEQFAGNRYVGLHIALGFDQEAKRPYIAEVFKGGPADLAGVKQKDVIEEIDGTSTEGQGVAKVVERLRGAEGTQVTIRVRQPKEADARVFTITRGALPHKTIEGIRTQPDGDIDVLVNANESIGYLKITEVLGSTPHELRVLARRLDEQGAKALVLDLRSVRQAHLHPAVLLADALLESGTIGHIRTARGVETFRAEPDALFRGWPLAVLVEPRSLATVRWLAAAFQDNHRAIIVGPDDREVRPGEPRTRQFETLLDDDGDVRTTVSIGDGSSLIQMATGRLTRSDGRVLIRATGAVNGGLTPDVITPRSQTARTRRPSAEARTAPPGNATTAPVQDQQLDAAVQRLRKLLGSP